MHKLEAHEVPLHKVFSSDYDFRIPDYQRPYAWQEEQAVQLLTDIDEALDRGSDEPYFLGSIVLVKDGGSSVADVIDGQQRLTTLTILLSVLRDVTEDEELRSELDRMVVEPGRKVLNIATKPRLTLRSRDAAFFKKYVQDRDTVPELLALAGNAVKTDAQRAVQVNARAFYRILADWTEDRRLALAQILSDRTFLVVVSTPDLESAHRIFSVMNSRGLDLSPTDIFKARIIGDLKPAAAEECAARWEDAEEALGREGFADLFLHLRMIYAKKRGEKELLKEFPEQVLSFYLPDRAEEFVNEVLEPYAEAYAQIRDGSFSAPSGAEKVNPWFKRLAQLDVNDWRPAALWALRNHGEDPQWLDRFFRALERLAASMYIRRVYSTPRVTRYAELLRQLDHGQGLASPAFQLSPEEKTETRAKLDGDIYPKIRKYVLLRLDELLAQSQGVTYDHAVITVEHVLPQNPKLGSQWTRLFDGYDRAHWTDRIANLVLLNRTKNSQAGIYDFATKKEKYFTGRTGSVPFALTSQVLQQTKWTPKVLEQRQKELVGRLVEEWDL